jgi:hypothetical protein
MAEAEVLQQELLARQNRDGGWGYRDNQSWTEPTAMALLALESRQQASAARDRGCAWLRANQLADGGWPPNPSIPTSTSVTSLAALAVSSACSRSASYARSIRWLLSQVKPDFTLRQRFEFWLQNMPAGEAVSGGSSWFPGTAAWIAPTVTTVLALEDARQYLNDGELARQIARGKQYILSRRLSDAGWNHGGTRYRGTEAGSYPETTGMALLALDCISELGPSLLLAEKMLRAPESLEGESWLRMALTKHGAHLPDPGDVLPFRTTRDIALRLLALSAGSSSNKFTIKA